ncbi:hypothetical protein MTO96_049656 [Rhipicephalus appendiculatus]
MRSKCAKPTWDTASPVEVCVNGADGLCAAVSGFHGITAVNVAGDASFASMRPLASYTCCLYERVCLMPPSLVKDASGVVGLPSPRGVASATYIYPDRYTAFLFA